MTHYDSTARVPFSKGGKVDKKPPKPKRIILWKGKAKDWPGAQKAKERTGKAKGGIISLKKGGMTEKKKSKAKTLLAQLKRDDSLGGTKKRPQRVPPKRNPDPTASRTERWKYAKGGKAKKNWIQGVNKSIKKRGTKGVCTGKKFGGPTCRPGTKRYNLAKTFKKMARAKHASGGLVRFI
jgi:hypothetical protein